MTREEHIAIYCGNCGNCIVCNDDMANASNSLFDRNLVWSFCEIRPGVFVLFDNRPFQQTGEPSKGSVLWMGPAEELIEAYRNRPPYVATPRPAREFATKRSAGKLSAEEKRANTAALLAKLKG